METGLPSYVYAHPAINRLLFRIHVNAAQVMCTGVAFPEIAIGRLRRLRSAPLGLGLELSVKMEYLGVERMLQVVVGDSVSEVRETMCVGRGAKQSGWSWQRGSPLAYLHLRGQDRRSSVAYAAVSGQEFERKQGPHMLSREAKAGIVELRRGQ